tara:strand:- start:175 stop:780 length:606 start_codon:yes stop_codon:yes gene_type:complete
MSIVKLNNRSVKDITQFGSISSLGSLAHISTQTASSSASINFTSGIDSTYKEYIFYFVNMHPSSDGANFTFQGSTDGGSNYNTTMTTTYFTAFHNEAGSDTSLTYESGRDLSQSTSFKTLINEVGNDNDQCCSGFLHLFNPSSATFAKHFICDVSNYFNADYNMRALTSGYFNSTSALNAVSYKFSSGNIDSGQILLFGLN